MHSVVLVDDEHKAGRVSGCNVNRMRNGPSYQFPRPVIKLIDGANRTESPPARGSNDHLGDHAWLEPPFIADTLVDIEVGRHARTALALAVETIADFDLTKVVISG